MIGKTSKEKAERRHQLLQKVHDEMDKQLEKHRDLIDNAIWWKDTRTVWRAIAKTIEHGFIDGLEVDDYTAKKMKGRDKPKFKVAKQERQDPDPIHYLTPQGHQARLATQQSRRCQQIADRIRKACGKGTKKDEDINKNAKKKILDEYAKLNAQTCAILITNINEKQRA